MQMRVKTISDAVSMRIDCLVTWPSGHVEPFEILPHSDLRATRCPITNPVLTAPHLLFASLLARLARVQVPWQGSCPACPMNKETNKQEFRTLDWMSAWAHEMNEWMNEWMSGWVSVWLRDWVGEWCKWLNELSVGCINQLGVYLKANKSTV